MRLRPSFTTISSALVPVIRLLHEPHARRAGRPVVELDALAQRAQRARRGHALDLGEVLLLDAVARMREQLRELAVVGEHQQAFGVAVEAADREHARLAGHEVEHGRRDPAGRSRS